MEQRTFRRVGATSTRSVDVRIVAATNRDLREMVAARTFREDLWYRLSAIALRVPPLRDRADDVAPLAQAFLADASRQYRRRWRGINDEIAAPAARLLLAGQRAELRAVMGRAARCCTTTMILRPRAPAARRSAPLLLAAHCWSAPAAGAPAASAIPTLEAVELAHIRRVLELCDGNRTLAAQYLDITRQTLARKLGGGAGGGAAEPEG